MIEKLTSWEEGYAALLLELLLHFWHAPHRHKNRCSHQRVLAYALSHQPTSTNQNLLNGTTIRIYKSVTRTRTHLGQVGVLHNANRKLKEACVDSEMLWLQLYLSAQDFTRATCTSSAKNFSENTLTRTHDCRHSSCLWCSNYSSSRR